MSNENYNNTGDWRSKLETLDNLPGEAVIDKNASWEKLHDRLREKKSSKKIIGYWSAAACLLLALMISLMNSNTKDRETAKIETSQKQAIIKSSPAILPDKKGSLQITSRGPVEKNQFIVAAAKSIKKYQVVATGVSKEIRLSATVSNPVFVEEANSTALQPVDTSFNLAALQQPVNKKLKVVHINELGEPVAESPGIARSYERHFFQVRIINQQAYTSPPSSGNTGFNIFKTKSTPSN